MTIDIVSYRQNITWEHQDELNCRLFNKSKADIILFPGWSFQDTNQLENFRTNISNIKTVGIMELKRLDSRKITNCLFIVQNGKLKYSSLQLFSTSNEINKNKTLGQIFIDQFANQKSFQIKNNIVRVMQCGELNILRNEQANNNKVRFRFFEDKEMNSEFSTLINNSKLIFNPQHTPMGNQGKMSKRREFLSSKGRAYFSTTNIEKHSKGFDSKSSHYAYYDSQPLATEKIDDGEFHALFQYKI